MNWKLKLWVNILQSQTVLNPNGHFITSISLATNEGSAVNSGKKKIKMKATKILQSTIVLMAVVKQTRTQTTAKMLKITTKAMQLTETKENEELCKHLVRLVAKLMFPQKNAPLEPMQQIDRLLGIEDQCRKARNNDKTHRTMQLKASRLRPKIYTKNPISSFRNCTWLTGDHQGYKTSTNSKGCLAATIRDICWPSAVRKISYWSCVPNNSTDQILQDIQLSDVASQTLPPNGLHHQHSGTITK